MTDKFLSQDNISTLHYVLSLDNVLSLDKVLSFDNVLSLIGLSHSSSLIIVFMDIMVNIVTIVIMVTMTKLYF